MVLPTDRLSVAVLKMQVIRALRELNAACQALNFDRALLAERQMNDGLDLLALRFQARAR